MSAAGNRVVLGGADTDLMSADDVVATLVMRAEQPDQVPLAVVSANLDHLHHFGRGGRWHGVIEDSRSRGKLDWLTLIDGAPLAAHAKRLTGSEWPRLAGSDLTSPILDAAEEAGLTVGFLGGAPETLDELRSVLAERRPRLGIAGTWGPPRRDLEDPQKSAELAREIRAAGPDLLVVGMGKPRQELWIAEYGELTGASVLLAFGAVVDFLADRVKRSPEWMASHGLEWSYRLSQEPRRLARRYLVDGPASYARLRRHSGLSAPVPETVVPAPRGEQLPSADLLVLLAPPPQGTILLGHGPSHFDALSGLRTTTLMADSPEAISRLSQRLAGPDDVQAVLVVDPALEPDDLTLATLWERLSQLEVGGVTGRVLNHDGVTEHTLCFESTPVRRVGEALLQDFLPARPEWATLVDRGAESYSHPHPIAGMRRGWLLLRKQTAAAVGAERLVRLARSGPDYAGLVAAVRASGEQVWYEPGSVVQQVAPSADTRADHIARMSGSIIVPAHNEAAVIERTLRPLSEMANDRVEVLVAANACTDRTVDAARAVPGVRVLDLPEPGKAGALNAADAVASRFPRLYLDADIEIEPAAMRRVFEVLEGGSVLAARPAFRYDTENASPLVAAYYRARMRLPETRSHLWGAGAYAVSAAGHERIGSFPTLTADDMFIDGLFAHHEKAVVDTVPVVVRTPRDLRGLLAVLTRQYRGNQQIDASPWDATPTTASTSRQLLLSARSPRALGDAVVYLGLAVVGRVLARRSNQRWERDESSRTTAP